MAKAEEQKNKLKEIKMSDPIAEQKPVDVEAFRKEGREAEATRRREIEAIAESFKHNSKIQELAREAKEKGLSHEDFARQAIKLNAEKPEPVSQVGMTEKEVQTYSFARVVRELFNGKNMDEIGGLEGEAHKAIADKLGRAPRGVCMPYEVQKRNLKRDNFTALQVAGTGSYLVDQYHDAASFVDLLYAESMAPKLGITMMPGLVGDVDIPKLTTGYTGYWVAESTAATKSVPVLGRVLFQPKTVAARSPISRKLIKQGTPAIESILMTNLARALADAVDVAITQGTGSDSQPAGLVKALTDASISAQTLTSVSYAKVLTLITGLQNAKAFRDGAKFLTTPAVAAILAATMKTSGTWSPLYDYDTSRMLGLPTIVSTNTKAAHLFLGYFPDMIMADWGMVELSVTEDTSNQDSGDKMLRGFFDVDLGVKRPASFQWSSSVTSA
jgi:HK97 family phage major capsid protein